MTADYIAFRITERPEERIGDGVVSHGLRGYHRQDMSHIQAYLGISRHPSRGPLPCRDVLSAMIAFLLLQPWLITVAAEAPGKPAPLVIEADKVQINDKTGVSVYKGNVQVTRGAVHLSCDDLTVHNADGQVKQSECNGRPAKFRRDAGGGKKQVHGNANRVEYYLEDEHVILLGDAHLVQDRDTFSGQHIIYYLSRDMVSADTAGHSSGRVRITIHPKAEEGVKDKQGR